MRKIPILLALAAIAAAASAHGATDPRKLSDAEQKMFFPLACPKPLAAAAGENCAALSGRNDVPKGSAVNLSLDAISYGAFTRADADQAYVTYDGDFEPHANNNGGGILFARAGGQWRLVRWYPGGQMDQCVALPAPKGNAAGARMLCLAGYAGMGEVDSSVWLDSVPDSDAEGAFAKASIGVLKAQDARQADNPNYSCTLRKGKDEAVLLSIDDLKRSAAPGVFAESKIAYAAAPDANAACAKGTFASVRETAGTVRYRLEGNKVMAMPTVKFSVTDY